MRIDFTSKIDGWLPCFCTGTVIGETDTEYHVISDTTYNRYIVRKSDYEARIVDDWDSVESI